MELKDYVEYQRREYCKEVHCPIQELMNQQQEGNPTHDALRAICKFDCIHTTHEFHQWLIQHGYLVVREAEK